jgi:capsular polysaccharide biosynthesis protein
LSPADFSFFGFGELTREEVRKIKRLGIRDDDPVAVSIEDAVFLPDAISSGADRARTAGGLVYANGEAVETAQTVRKGGKRFWALPDLEPPLPEQVLDEKVVYLGLLFNHFGRVLLESLARVWYLSHVDASIRVVFTNANAAQDSVTPWLSALLTEFGIPPSRLWTAQEPTRLRRTIVPEALFEQFYSAHVQMVEPFHRLARRVASDVARTEQPLYLSRGRLSSRQRPVIGEAELEEILRQNGFRIAYPETMSLVDQVRMINQHKTIFSPIGSAAHSILFALHQPAIHLLADRDDIPANYFLCSAIAAAPTTFVNAVASARSDSADDDPAEESLRARRGAEGRADDPNAGFQSRPQMVNFEAVSDYLRTAGFLKTQPASPAPTVRQRLDDRFEEAWVYARVRKATGKADALPRSAEIAAIQHAHRSWPVCLMLARAYARAGDTQRAECMAQQFTDLLERETDERRLSYYGADVASMIPRIVRVCSQPVARRLRGAVRERWPGTEIANAEVAVDS